MTVEQLNYTTVWIMDNTTGLVTLEPNELGLAIYEDDGATKRHVGYVRISDGRVVLWYPERKVSV